MRKITLGQIASFALLAGTAVTATYFTAGIIGGWLPANDFRGLILFLAGAVLFYIYAIAIYRLFLAAFPLRPGDIPPKSRNEAVYHVYILFYLLVFYPVMRSGIPPAPFMRVFYLALGARLGANTYSQGIIHDPPFVTIGNDSVVGQSALLIPHVIEGDKLAHYPIKIGNRVTIGANSAVLSDVTIGDEAIVATGSVVPKGTRIGPGEVWGGVPAKRIR